MDVANKISGSSKLIGKQFEEILLEHKMKKNNIKKGECLYI